jgi:penicillin-binding protein 2
MKAVASTGTASSAFTNYKVPVAAKTGTVQSDAANINTGVFICYAPADKPEIAIAVVVEKGGSGSAIISVAKDIMDYYFTDRRPGNDVKVENTFLK